MAVAQKIRQFMSESGWIRRVFEEGLALKAHIGSTHTPPLPKTFSICPWVTL